MRLELVKCHGSGNDFPLIDARGIALADDEWATVARSLADRRGPVGGDGLLLLTEAIGGADFAMRMFNSDGSEAEVCLNGLRCVARMGFEALGITRARVALKASMAEVERVDDVAPGVHGVRETAGPASLDTTAWPAELGSACVVDGVIPTLDGERRFIAVAMPNPHLVAFVKTIDEAALIAIGEACEAAPRWLPRRANVSFVALRGADGLFVRTFERGVGLTDSCGSAMAASTFAACLTGRREFGRTLTVFNRGGLVRSVAHDQGMVVIEGNATWEWRGSIDVDLHTGIARAIKVDRQFNDEIAAWTAVATAAAKGYGPIDT